MLTKQNSNDDRGEDIVVDATPVDVDDGIDDHFQESEEDEGGDPGIAAVAVAGGVAGMILGGPILAIAGGAGAVYASTQQGAAGDIARASGTLAIDVGRKARDLDEKHKFYERSQTKAKEIWASIREYDEKHGTIHGIRQFLSRLWDKSVQFESKHHVLETIFVKASQGAKYLAELIRQRASDGSDENDAK